MMLIHAVLKPMMKSRWSIFVFCGSALLIGYILTKCDLTWDVVHITKMPLAYAFYLIGQLCSQYHLYDHLKKIGNRGRLVLVTLLVLVTIIGTYLNQPVFWYTYDLGSFHYFVSTSLSGIGSIALLSVWIDHFSLLGSYGENSIVVYSIQFLIFHITMYLLNTHIVTGLLGAIIGFIITSAFCFMVTKIIVVLRKDT